MTLEELENTLPNGLHDAEVQRIAVDYQRRKVTLDIAVWVGDVSDSRQGREAYKSGQIEISGLLFVVMEPPDPNYPFKSSGLRIDGCNMSKNLGSDLLTSLPTDAFFRSLMGESVELIYSHCCDRRSDFMDGRSPGQFAKRAKAQLLMAKS